MNPKLKVPGLALVAVLAMSAFMTQSTFAHSFEAESSPIDLTADDDGGTHIFKSGNAQIECKTTTFSGTFVETPTFTFTLTPTYSECELSGVKVAVINEGCSYIFDSNTVADANTGGNSAPVTITCTAGKAIVVIATLCTIDFEFQTLPSGIRYTKTGVGKTRDLTVEAHVFNIEYNATNNGCALLGITKGIHNDGTYLGNAVVRGYKAGSAHTEANQVGVFFS